MINVENTVKIYEIGGKENKDAPEEIKIHSHWNRSEMVNIELPGFAKITVAAKDLKAAIDNAQNVARY
jgi:hypothetical protein